VVLIRLGGVVGRGQVGTLGRISVTREKWDVIIRWDDGGDKAQKRGSEREI